MTELNVQQKNIINQLKQAYPELKSYSHEQILSLYNQQLNNIQLSEAEKISIMNGKNGVVNDGMGIQLETSQKTVSKEQESQLKSALTARLNAVSTNVKKAEDSNGFLGSMWSGFKNLTGIGDSSDKVREQQKADLKALESGNIAEAFKKITGLDYTVENVNKFLNNEVQTKSETALNGYTEGQEMASDITADIVSGIAAVGIYTAAVAAAPFTGGASIAVGVVAAGASAAAIKTGIKYADAKSDGREYTADNLKKDLATGAFSGVLAPITGGMGGAVGKTVATKVGIQAVKQVGKEVAEEAVEQTAKGFVKTMLTNPTGYEYIGGSLAKRGLAFAAEAATDGAIGGAVDNAFRTAYDGGGVNEIAQSAVEGFVGGAIMSPVIGGGMKVAGKGAQKIFGKNNVEIDANGNRVRVNDDGTVVRIDADGNEIPASATDAEIHIPKGVLASDIAPFIETDDGFKNIARNRARDIAELDKIKDVDEFLEKSFSMIKEEMGLADSSIKLVIGNDNYYDLETNTVFINRNWQNGDKAELFGAIAHELDHFLQWKEVIRNLDENHPMYKAVYEQLTSTEEGIDNFTYILEKYNDTPVTELTKKQAKEYADNWQNYIEPTDPKAGKVDVTSEQYKRYKEQPVEAEAMRRGNTDINSRLATASSREDFAAIRDEIKAMPKGAEKTALQQEYLRKYNEFSRKYNEEFDIRMEYKPDGNGPHFQKAELTPNQQRAYNRHLDDLRTDIKSQLLPNELERAEKLITLLKDHFIKFSDGSHKAYLQKISDTDIVELARISDLNFARLENLVRYLNPNSESNIGALLNQVVKISDQNFEKVQSILKGKAFDLQTLSNFLEVNFANISRIENLLKSKNIDPEIIIKRAKTLTSMNDEMWTKVIQRDMLSSKNLLEILPSASEKLTSLARLDDATWNKVIDRNLLNSKSVEIIELLAELSDEQFSKLIKLGVYDIDNNELKIAPKFIDEFLELNQEQQDRLFKYNILERDNSNKYNRTFQMLNGAQVLILLKSSAEEFQKIIDKNLFDIKIDGRLLKTDEIMALADCDVKIIEKVTKEILPLNPKMSIKEALVFSELPSEKTQKIKRFNLFEEKVVQKLFSPDIDDNTVMIFSAFKNPEKGNKSLVNLRPTEILKIVELDDQQIINILTVMKNEKIAKFAFEDLTKISKLNNEDFLKVLNTINDNDENLVNYLISYPLREKNGQLFFDETAYKQLQEFYNCLGDMPYADIMLRNFENPNGTHNAQAAERVLAILKDTNDDILVRELIELATSNSSKTFDEGFIQPLEEADYMYKSMRLLVLKECIDAKGNFDRSIYERVSELSSKGLFEITAPQILKACRNKDGSFNEEVYKKAFELYEMGHDKQAIGFVLQASRDLDGNFSHKILERIHKEVYNWTPNDFPRIIQSCLDNKGNFNELAYQNLLKLKASERFTMEQIVDFTSTLKGFSKYLDKTNINELSITEKRELLKELVKANASLFKNDFMQALKILGYGDTLLYPKNREEYCALLPKLIKSIGIDTKPLSKEIEGNYYVAMNRLMDADGVLSKIDFDNENISIGLKYSRNSFISDVEKLLETLTRTERNKAMDYFGFELIQRNDGILQMNGYPINVNNGAKMSEIADENTRNIIEKIRPLVERFSNQNEIIVENNPALAKELNDIIKAFPEFITIIGKKQHSTHDFTVDIHTLKVLQGIATNPRYQKLPDADKRILQIATLMHDLTKAENLTDKTHPQYSAYDTYYLLEKMELSESEKLKVYQIIKNHDWLERLNKAGSKSKEIARDIAFQLREGNLFEMASILTEADLKGVKANDSFYIKYRSVLEDGNIEVQKLVEELQKTSIYLPQTRIPKASEIKLDGERAKIEVTTDEAGNQISNTVIYLDKSMDLSQYGFADGLKAEDLNVLVHALNYENQSAIFQALGQVDSDALLSSSYVTYRKGNYHVFRTQGFILDVANTDIHAGTYMDFGSGYGKDLQTLKTQYLFNGARKEFRNFFSQEFKKILNLTDDEYLKLYNEIYDKTILELDETHPEVAKKIRELFDAMEVHKRTHGRDYNEILISRPKIQAIFWQGKVKDSDIDKGLRQKYTIEKVPEFLRKYAQENNLPIIYFGE